MNTDWRINLALALGVFLFCLPVSEIVLRIFGQSPPARLNEPLFTYSDTLGWIGRPGLRTVQKKFGQALEYAFNSWGFRDAEPPPFEAVKDKRRFMFLGDSFIMGHGVPSEHRVSDQVQRLDSTIQCYNFGLDNYGTDQELLILKKYGPVIKPEVVLVFFCMNDLASNESNWSVMYKSQFRLGAGDSLILEDVPVFRPSMSLLGWAKDNLALAYTAWKVRTILAMRSRDVQSGTEIRATRNESRTDLDSLELTKPAPRNNRMTLRLLKEIQFQCERLGAKLIVFNTPNRRQWSETRDDTPMEYQQIMEGCRSLGIRTVDLFPAFRHDYLEHGDNLFISDNRHWNARGHLLAAQEVLDDLHAVFSADSTKE
jgi:hypothetical protein